jgi:tRNA dimethylallyltransferase
VPVSEEFSVAQFAERAHREIDTLLEAGRPPLVVGGAGLYVRAALTDLELKPPPSAGLRQELDSELAELGPEAMHSRLPAEVARGVHPRDRKRIVRALELERMGERSHANAEQLWSRDLCRPAALFGIVMDRESLGEQIAERVRSMLSEGAVEEVELALERGVSRTARKAIGFKEIEAYLQGGVSLEEVAERIERRQRQYVRRQLTWMRKLPGVETIDRTGLEGPQAAQAIVERLDSLPPPWA